MIEATLCFHVMIYMLIRIDYPSCILNYNTKHSYNYNTYNNLVHSTSGEKITPFVFQYLQMVSFFNIKINSYLDPKGKNPLNKVFL